MNKLQPLFLLLFILIICACSYEEKNNWATDNQRINELLNLSSENITIEGTTLELHAYLWRDFMPISPPDGKSLISINWLLDKDSINIPSHISLSQQYVIYGDSLWTADYTTEQRDTPPYLIERVSRNGPKWGPHVEVTVVVKVVDLNNNSEYYLRKENQFIKRTD